MTFPFQKIDLRELSQMEGSERAFISFYFSGEEGLNTLDNRAKRIRTMLEDAQPEELEHFDESMKMLRAAIEKHSFDAEGYCLFVSWVLDFVRGYPLPMEVETVLRVDAAPYLRPIAEMQEEYENFLIVAADANAARIILVTSAEPDMQDQIKGDVKNKVKKGGWSQQRYARRRENELNQYAKEVAESLGELARDEKVKRIIMFGAQEATAAIARNLPSQIAEKVVGREKVDLHDDEQELVEKAYELFWKEERDEEDQLWNRIQNEYLRHGQAAVGPTDVLEAVQIGRVEEMIVTRDTKIAGMKCRDCENIMHGEPETCQTCESKSIFAVDLVDELVRQLELTSAKAEFVDPIPGLSKLGDVAALLRY